MYQDDQDEEIENIEEENIEIENRNSAFRYKSFSERIKNIKIDIFHNFKKNHLNENKDINDMSTYFTSTIEDWKDYNLTVLNFFK
jgi:hypothetical protein